jgi:hypothetical protein
MSAEIIRLPAVAKRKPHTARRPKRAPAPTGHLPGEAAHALRLLLLALDNEKAAGRRPDPLVELAATTLQHALDAHTANAAASVRGLLVDALGADASEAEIAGARRLLAVALDDGRHA